MENVIQVIVCNMCSNSNESQRMLGCSKMLCSTEITIYDGSMRQIDSWERVSQLITNLMPAGCYYEELF